MGTSILADRNFRLLTAGNTISALGSWLLIIAVPYQVFHLTGSTTATGVALAVEGLPALLVGPWAGALIDRWSLTRVMVAANLAAAGGVLPITLATGPHRVALVYAGLLAENLAVVFLRPAVRALTPAIVGTGPRLNSANSLSAAIGGATRLAGPVLGVLLLTVAGVTAVVVIDAATYLVAAALTARLRHRPASAAHSAAPSAPPVSLPVSSRVAADLVDGLRRLAGDPTLRGLLATSFLFLTANAALTALLVPFTVERLGAAGRDTGYLVAALGVGYLMGAEVTRRLPDRAAPRTVICLAQAAVGVCFLALFSTTGLAAAIVAAGLVGVPGVILLTTIQTRIQRVTPAALLGRIGAAFYAGDATAMVVGALVGPATVAALGLPAALIALSAAALATTLASVFLLPRS